MRIGIDARLYGTEHAGIGRYTQSLLHSILKLSHKHDYVIFTDKKYFSDFDQYQNVTLVNAKYPIYSFSEQLLFPVLLYQNKLDLLHVPHFNLPLFYCKTSVVTIHDLIKNFSKGPETTTRHPWLYALKRLGYLFITKITIAKVKHLITPSEYVKNDLIKHYHVNENKISVTHEAVFSQLKKTNLNPDDKKEILKKYGLTQPFLIYTGSLYPHKNVEMLLRSIGQYNREKELDLHLILISARSVFLERLENKIKDLKLGHRVKLLGYVPDSDLPKIYSLALALVQPSLMEGFGLTGLEAMKLDLPVVSSNATCLPEIYGDAAIYFDPHHEESFLLTLEMIVKDKELRQKLILNGQKQAKKFSWHKTAKLTLAVYQDALK